MKTKAKRFFDRVVAVVLSVVMFAGIAEVGIGTSVVNAADELPEKSGGSVSTQNDISVNSTNSFGDLLSKEISNENIEESESVGYKIFTAEVTGNKVSVEFQTLESGTLVAAIYDEDGTTLISTGKTDISAEDTTAVITLDTDSMPEYFYLRVFLVDKTTLRPMCKVYDCPNYTKEMQEFLAKTTDDFDSDSVLNFDNDKSNNFAVYSDKTNVIPESKTKNKVVSANDESGVYVFENIDSNISSLKSGDIFAYNYGDDLIIVKVDNITIDGTKATVTSQETSMDEVFNYVKIDAEADLSEATVDASNLDEGITYKGMSSDKRDVNERKLYADRASQNGIARSMDLDVENELSSEFELDLFSKGDEEQFSIKGGLKFSLKPSFKLYMDNKCKFCEFNLGYSAELSIKLKGKFEVSHDLASFEIPVFTGITVAVTPKIFFEGEITVEFNTTLEGSVGGRATDTNGLENISKSPTFNPELKVEGALFLGFALEPSINIISKYVAMIGLEAKVGVEVKATYSIIKPKEDYIHECKNCIDGEISFKMSLEMEMKLLNMDKLKFKLTLTDITIHLLDFYWSLDFGEFGFSECPHKKYRLEIKTVDQSKTPVVGAFVEVNGETHTTDSNGVVVVEVPAKFLTIYAHKNGVGNDTRKNFNIEYDKKSITMVLSSQGNFKFNQGLSGNNFDIPSATKGNWAYVTVQEATTAAIDKQGNLYMWGRNDYGQIGDGTSGYYNYCLTPKKIMSNVASVSLSSLDGNFLQTTAAIDKSGNLYMWGANDCGQVGDGTTDNCLTPKKILSNVDCVSMCDGTTAAIDRQGNLYMWGDNEFGAIGDGTEYNHCLTPKKIMSNVASVCLSDSTTAAIDKQGNLYMWGGDFWGQIGDGTSGSYNCCLTPKKIMSNVECVSLEYATTAAIDKQRNLYMWGYNRHGQIGDGTKTDCLTPKKIMSNVNYVGVLGDFERCSIATIDKKGNLYMWGDNCAGQIGDGTKTDCLTPKKIMSNVDNVNMSWLTAAAIDKQGNLYMWGDNELGAIGDGTYDDCLTPKKIMSNVRYVSTDVLTTAAIDKQGNLYMWGFNIYGQIGDGTTDEDRYTPTLIPCPTDTSKILNTKAQPIATVKATSANTKTKQFTSLTPNCTYNFYVVQTRDTKDILSDDNLLYISQATADENGKLTVTYDTAKEFEREECFVIQAQQTDIANAEIKIDSITANGTEQSIEPIVTVDGETLMNGIDYDLAGDFKVKEPGEYTITVLGTGMYKGEKTIKFNVQKAKSTGDTNNDGEVNIADALMISRYDAGLAELNESQLAVSDVNNDGEVNIADALMISRFDAGLINEL